MHGPGRHARLRLDGAAPTEASDSGVRRYKDRARRGRQAAWRHITMSDSKVGRYVETSSTGAGRYIVAAS